MLVFSVSPRVGAVALSILLLGQARRVLKDDIVNALQQSKMRHEQKHGHEDNQLKLRSEARVPKLPTRERRRMRRTKPSSDVAPFILPRKNQMEHVPDCIKECEDDPESAFCEWRCMACEDVVCRKSDYRCEQAVTQTLRVDNREELKAAHEVRVSTPDSLKQLNYCSERNASNTKDSLFIPSEKICTATSCSRFAQWCRAVDAESAGKAKSAIFGDGVVYEQIAQGELGTCYLHAALAAVAHKHKRLIDEMFIDRELWDAGTYVTRWFWHGKFIEVAIDDCVPCDDHASFIFARRAFDGALWPVLLEKAWAKLHSSYVSLDTGSPAEALAALTHAPILKACPASRGVCEASKQAHFAFNLDAPTLFETLQDWTRRDYPMVTAFWLGNKDVDTGHAYMLKSVHVENGLQVAEMFNPWNINRSATFTVQWEDFYKLCSFVMAASVGDGSVSTFKLRTWPFLSDSMNHWMMRVLTISATDPFVVQVSFPSSRLVCKDAKKGCKECSYPAIRVLLQKEGQPSVAIDETYSEDQVTSKEGWLLIDPGAVLDKLGQRYTSNYSVVRGRWNLFVSVDFHQATWVREFSISTISRKGSADLDGSPTVESTSFCDSVKLQWPHQAIAPFSFTSPLAKEDAFRSIFGVQQPNFDASTPHFLRGVRFQVSDFLAFDFDFYQDRMTKEVSVALVSSSDNVFGKSMPLRHLKTWNEPECKGGFVELQWFGGVGSRYTFSMKVQCKPGQLLSTVAFAAASYRAFEEDGKKDVKVKGVWRNRKFCIGQHVRLTNGENEAPVESFEFKSQMVKYMVHGRSVPQNDLHPSSQLVPTKLGDHTGFHLRDLHSDSIARSMQPSDSLVGLVPSDDTRYASMLKPNDFLIGLVASNGTRYTWVEAKYAGEEVTFASFLVWGNYGPFDCARADWDHNLAERLASAQAWRHFRYT